MHFSPIPLTNFTNILNNSKDNYVIPYQFPQRNDPSGAMPVALNDDECTPFVRDRGI